MLSQGLKKKVDNVHVVFSIHSKKQWYIFFSSWGGSDDGRTKLYGGDMEIHTNKEYSHFDPETILFSVCFRSWKSETKFQEI